MNELYVKKKVELPERGFLLIDDEVPEGIRARVFDPHEHWFNPLHGMGYKQSREFTEAIYTIFSEGENTLTVRNGKRALVRLLSDTKRLDKIGVGLQDVDSGTLEALETIKDILVSPVLKPVLCNPKRGFSFNSASTIVARINRAELGEFDALVLGLMLMNYYKGQLIVPDFGFYGRKAHISLIREERLIAGVNFLDELPKELKQMLLLMKSKHVAGATYEDAKLLAYYSGLKPDPNKADNEFNRFVDAAMS